MEPATPRKIPHKKPPLPLKRPKITFWEKKYRGENEEGITMNIMQHLTSMDLNDKEAEKEILEVLKYYLNDYKEIPENHQDPEFKKNLEKDITIFQNYVNNQSGGRRRKKKTRKKRGGRFVDVTPEYIRENFDQLAGRKVEISEEGFPKKIIIYKLLDETGDIVDYKEIIPIPTFFYYINVDDNQDNQTPRLLGVIDLTEYGPGSIKINVANIQDGSGKRRKKKKHKKRGGCWPNCFKKKSNSNSGEFAKTKPPQEQEMPLIEHPNQEVRRRGLLRIPSMATLSKGKEKVENWQRSRSTSPTMDPFTAAHHNLSQDHFAKVDKILEKAAKKGLGGGRRKKKTRRKRGSHHEALLLGAVAASKLINKKRKKKNKKIRTKKKSRRRRKRR